MLSDAVKQVGICGDETMKIKDMCTYAPKSNIKAGDATVDGQYMFFTSSEDESKRYREYQFDGEGIIMGTGGNATLHYYNGKFAVSTDCVVLLPKNKLRCKYLYYFFLANLPILEVGFKGAGLKHTNKGYIGNIELEVPSLESQDNVISVLDRVYDAIRLRNKELSLFDNLVKARFVEIFGDTECNKKGYPIHQLSELCTVSSSKRIYQSELSNFGVPFLRISNLVELIDTKHFTSDLFISKEKYDELFANRLVPDKGDILVTSRGTLGRCYIVQKDDRFYFQDGMISWLYDFDKKVNPLYLAILFDTKDIKQQINNLQSGSTVAYLSIAMLKKINIVVPPLELQNEFSVFFAQVDKLKAAVQKALEETQNLFDSLMQEYFG